MKAIIELDHSEKWAAALKYPSRADLPNFFLPGTQVFFYSAGTKKNRKDRASRSTPGNWHGPAVVIGTEWDKDQSKESYWLRYQGRCRLVPNENMRYATMEESLSREQVVDQIKSSLTSLSEERKPFTFDDDRKGSSPGVAPSPVIEKQYEPPDTPVFPQDPVSIQEATKKFFEGKMMSPYYGDLPRTSAVTQIEHRVQDDNLQGHDSRVRTPPPMAEDLTSPVPDPSFEVEYEPSSPAEEPEEDPAELIEDRNFTPGEASEAPHSGNPEKQRVFFV